MEALRTVELDNRRVQLRADVASGVPVSVAQEASLNALAAQRVHLSDERSRLNARLLNPPAESGPHDHLRHRQLPIAAETRSRLRLLSIWSAVSTPLLLVALGLAFLPARSLAILSTALVWTLIVLGIEAAARRHFAGYIVGVIVLVLIVAVLAGFVLSIITWGWRYATAGMFGTLAAILLFANVQELGRD